MGRDHFSFSSKICVGEYIDATTNQRHSEAEVRSTILQIKEHRAKGAKEKTEKELERSESDQRDNLELEAEAILRRLEAEEAQDKTRKEYLTQFDQQNKLSWPGSGPLPALGQQDMTREGIQKEQERIKKQEELRKEKEERERRRYHGVLVRAIEARKKYEDKERKREELKK